VFFVYKLHFTALWANLGFHCFFRFFSRVVELCLSVFIFFVSRFFCFFSRVVALKDDLDSTLPLTVASFLTEASQGLGVLALAAAAVPPFLVLLPFVFYSFWGITQR
jgi:hypothetical protein